MKQTKKTRENIKPECVVALDVRTLLNGGMVDLPGKGYSIGQTPVCQGLWKKVMKTDPFEQKGDDLPANGLSVVDCWRFLVKLNNLRIVKESGKVFRLPTKEEWIFAFSGRKRKDVSLSDMGWFSSNSEGVLHPVGKREPNAFGLFDMAGNVSELCSDGIHRGGDYLTDCSRYGATDSWTVLWSHGGMNGRRDEGFRVVSVPATECGWWTTFEPECWVKILEHDPKTAKRCEAWSFFSNEDWRNLLSKQPKFIKKCNIDILEGFDWYVILAAQPSLEKKCNWDLLNEDYWSRLICEQPQFAERCDKWTEMDALSWRNIICEHPQFAERCNKWDEMSALDWSFIFAYQPQFTERCDKWDLFDGTDWENILSKSPQLAKRCDWGKLSKENVSYILERQPQLKKYVTKQKRTRTR